MQFYVPEEFANRWNEVRDGMPGKSHKLLCTGAFAMFLGLPPEAQLALYEWAHKNELRPENMNSGEAVLVALHTIKRASEANIRELGRVKPMPVVPVNEPPRGGSDDIAHEVTRILDPAFLASEKRKRGVA